MKKASCIYVLILFFSPFITFAQTQKKSEQPEFIGGQVAMFKFLQYNIRYPKPARDQGLKGTVNAVFVVEKDGSLTVAKNKENIVADIAYFTTDTLYVVGRKTQKEQPEHNTVNDPILLEEANRVVQLMPKWKPATKEGTPIKAMYGFVIKYLYE